MSDNELKQMMNDLITKEEKRLYQNNKEFMARHNQIMEEAERQIAISKKNLESLDRAIPRMVTIKEAAKTGILPEHCLRKMVKQNEIPYVMAGTRCLINLDKLIDYLESGWE